MGSMNNPYNAWNKPINSLVKVAGIDGAKAYHVPPNSDVDASITLTPVAAGNYTVALFEDGVAIPGANQTMTAGAGATVNFNIPALVRLQCCDDSATLTLVLTTTALPATIALNNVGVVVEKI
jgi:hypothetical protein